MAGCSSEEEGDVRLTNGAVTSVTSGRVEICHDSEWGTVCSHKWIDINADVVCRQIGFKFGSRSTKTYDTGSFRIWMHYTNCIGHEARLADCEHQGWDWLEPMVTQGDPYHCKGEAVAVTCSGRCKFVVFVVFCFVLLLLLLF